MAHPSTFLDTKDTNRPIGIAATQDGLLFTTYEGQPSIFKVTDTKVVSVFAATFPTASGSIEKYLDINPGLGPWANKLRFVYVTQGSQVFEITPNGCTVKLFTTIPSGVATHTGITFDRVGTFNYDMILADVSGNVFRVNSGGTVSHIASLNKMIENPAVVPATLGPRGGEIWVAAEKDKAVFSINSSGVVNPIVSNLQGAENITVIPAAPTNLGSSGGSYFAADYPTRIVEYPASDFFSFGGNVLVGTESTGPLSMIAFTSGAYHASVFQPNASRGQAEGAAFVQNLSHPYIYAAKFVCGCFQPGKGHAEEGPVEPGSYTTAINVHNPNYCSVTMAKKAVLLFNASEKDKAPEIPRPPYPTRTVELNPDWGLEIDCDDIRNVLLSGPKAPIFIKGWVIIESPDPLDVVAVYTVRGLDEGSSVSVETDRVVPTRLS